jgi:sulfate adenylyltransferase subunit 2
MHSTTDKTEALRRALNKHRFDATTGGAKRDKEKLRAKERVFSHRTVDHRCDPRQQRRELWSLFNLEKRKEEGYF